jgi:circadian clock protein KaiC
MMNDPKPVRKVQILEKAPTGIAGFDENAHGGLPRGRTSLVVGGPGSGKTVFALQTLVNGARDQAEPGIFIAFEESVEQIIANAATFGWDIPALEAERLFFLDARLPSDAFAGGGFDLAGLLSSLAAKAAEIGARRIVFDSIDVLLAYLDDPLAARRELYRIHDWLSNSGMTGIITSRVNDTNPYGSMHYSFLQFMSDCVVLLSHYLKDRVSVRTLRIVKYRGSAFAENEAPFTIGASGIEVAGSGPLQFEYEVSQERVSTGVERLDTMLQGGYYQGTSVLITGAPGTAKSTLCGAFVEAACLRGDRALYVSFDEAGNEIVRNLASVGIRLAPHVESGRLRMASIRTEGASAEEHYLILRNLIREHGPCCMVVDPLSAMLRAGGQISAVSIAERLLNLTKAEGITLVCTSLLEGTNPIQESSPVDVSTIADTWIHLSYVAQRGERNRELTIIKSRGTGHSNQVRELVLNDAGVSLTDAYAAGGEVLLGTLRWEKEAEEEIERERAQADWERRVRELELAEAEAQARIELLRREVEARRAELALLHKERQLRERQRQEWNSGIRDRRNADTASPSNAADDTASQ